MSTTQVRGDTTRTGLVIKHLERIADSTSGNPRFRVSFTDGTAHRTMSDAEVNYGLENPEFRGVPLTVTFTVHGNIRRAVPERARIEPQDDINPFPELRGKLAASRPHVITADEARAEAARIHGRSRRPS